MNAVTEIAPLLGIVAACTTLAVARATYYRTLRPRSLPAPRRTPPRALSADERQAVLNVPLGRDPGSGAATARLSYAERAPGGSRALGTDRLPDREPR